MKCIKMIGSEEIKRVSNEKAKVAVEDKKTATYIPKSDWKEVARKQ